MFSPLGFPQGKFAGVFGVLTNGGHTPPRYIDSSGANGGNLPANQMNNKVVLIAEDNHDDYFLIQRAFRRADIPVELKWVRDGSEAKAYLDAISSIQPVPALILADLKMPRMDGFELLTWVRSHPRLRRLPFVVLTSSSQSPDINRAYDMGANSYLVKPSRFEELMSLSQGLKNYWLTLNQSPELPSSS
jgi:CheY-like chemotaxis protein